MYEDRILEILHAAGKPMTGCEIWHKLGTKTKETQKALWTLISLHKAKVTQDGRFAAT